MQKKAILTGASGSIGSSLLQQLLTDSNYSGVLVIARHPLPIDHPKLKQLIVDFDQLRDYAAEITGTTVFCCLGTTKSQTPDKAQYRKIDYQYPLDMARIAQENGAESYHFVSALGADIHSSIFYSKTKGEAEQALKTVPFPSMHIYRPSLLDGHRTKKRFAEGIMNVMMRIINPVLIAGLRKYRSIKVEDVAKAMLLKSLENRKGYFIHQSDEIQAISRAH